MTEATGKSLPPRPRGRRSPMGGGGKSWLLNSAEKMLIIILSWCRWDRLILYRCCVKIVQRFNINTTKVRPKGPQYVVSGIRLVSKQIKVLLGFCKLPSPIAGTVGLINYYGIFWLVSSQDGVWLFWQIRHLCCQWFLVFEGRLFCVSIVLSWIIWRFLDFDQIGAIGVFSWFKHLQRHKLFSEVMICSWEDIFEDPIWEE